MHSQEENMTPEEMWDKIEDMKEKMLNQDDLLRKMGMEKEDVMRELEVVYVEMDVNARRGRNKKVSKAGKTVDRQVLKIVAELMTEIFRHYKFTLKNNLLKWTEEEDGSFCARVRAAFDRAKILFNKLAWRAVCDMAVDWLVKQRSFYVTHVRNACFGEGSAATDQRL